MPLLSLSLSLSEIQLLTAMAAGRTQQAEAGGRWQPSRREPGRRWAFWSGSDRPSLRPALVGALGASRGSAVADLKISRFTDQQSGLLLLAFSSLGSPGVELLAGSAIDEPWGRLSPRTSLV